MDHAEFDDPHADLRQEVAKLCARYPGDYWRKLDRERANLDRTLDALHRTVSRDIVPIQLPIGEERGFSGVVDVVRMKAFSFAANDTAQMSEISIPLALAAKASAAHDELVERVAEADEALLEIFFAEGTLTQEQLESGLRNAVFAAKIFRKTSEPCLIAPSANSICLFGRGNVLADWALIRLAS